MKGINQHNYLSLLSLLVILLLGLFSKFYTGWGQQWVNNNVAGVWYEVFWCVFFFLFFPSAKNVTRIPVIVFLLTSLLEFMQLWHPLWLERIRSYLLGRLLLGHTFSKWDFPYYLIGCIIGAIWLQQIYRFPLKVSNKVK